MRLRFLSPLVALCAASSGCVEDVPIAAECPPDYAGPCLVELDGGEPPPQPEDPPPTARIDGGVRADAASDGDAVSGTSLPPLPAIRNESFEFQNDTTMPGDVTALSTPFTDISPWYTCQPIAAGQTGNSLTAVRAEDRLEAGTTEGAPKVAVGPSQGNTFITIGYLVNIVPMPLLQRLSTPLRAGQEYAFAIDALATSADALLSLEVRGNEQGCLGGQSQSTLVRSPPITSQDWTTVCVRFTPSTDLSYLILAAEPNFPDSNIDPGQMLIEGDLLGGPRLVFDNIREATSERCPEL
jgi:hypothetical protein